MSQSDEAKKLAKDFETPSRTLTPVMGGTKIAEPLLYDKTTLFHQFRELKLQGTIKRLLKEAIEAKREIDINQAITDACNELEIKREWADKYFESNRYKKWYADRMKEIEDHSGLSIEYLASIHKDNLEGKKILTSSQLDSAKELGDRIWPKVSKIEHEISQKESTTLDDLPDYQKKVDELEEQFRKAIPASTDGK